MRRKAGKIAIAVFIGSFVVAGVVGALTGTNYRPYAEVQLRAIAGVDSRPPECFAANPLLQPDSDVELLVDGNVVATTRLGVGRHHGPYCVFDVGASVPDVGTVTVRVADQTFTVDTTGPAHTATVTTDPYDAFGLIRRA